MYHIRTVKTASGATAVQVVAYGNGGRVIAAHIGSARDEKELGKLRNAARRWIAEHGLFPPESPLDEYEYRGVRQTFLHEALCGLLGRLGFAALGDSLLRDLVVIRIVEPCSKLRSLELLNTRFGIRHQRKSFYAALSEYVQLKGDAERAAVRIAKKSFGFDFSIVFYDVTTLYYESFSPDDLRRHGFSKDNKPQQPQIVLGLVVTREGFPVAYELFPGNKFEGHTFIPAITAFRKAHGITRLIVVADAAMLSLNNVVALAKERLFYIVGARTGNLPPRIIEKIASTLEKRDGATLRVKTERGDLVCGYSKLRAAKDRRDMERQIDKAKAIVNDPGKAHRTKFLQARGARYAVNEALVKKTESLLGVKGYYTNIPAERMPDAAVVERYHDLWRVEQAFRVAKGDLAARPIFHVKREAIEVHLLICFMALAAARYAETKTGVSLRRILDILGAVTDATLVEKATGKRTIMRLAVPDETKNLLKKLGLPH